MSTLVIREKPMKPAVERPGGTAQRPAILTRAELAPCTCPEHCERDHEND